MSVTAAITAYNRAAYLPGALDSVFAQTRSPDEVLVVDDGSTDDTPDVLAGYGDRIRVVRQENAGRSGARNTAVRAARGVSRTGASDFPPAADHAALACREPS